MAGAHYASSATEVTTTSSATWATVAELVFTPDTTGNHDILGYIEFTSNSATVGAQARVIHVESGDNTQAQREPNEVSSPPDYFGHLLIGEVSLTAGTPATIRVQVKSSFGSSTTVSGRNAHIVVWRRNADDLSDVDVTGGDTAANTTPVEVASCTVGTTGTYLVIGALHKDGDPSSAGQILLRNNGTQSPAGSVIFNGKDASDSVPAVIAGVASLTAGDVVTMDYNSVSSVATTYSNVRLLLWRLDNLSGWSSSLYNQVNTIETASTSTSYVDTYCTLTFTPEAAPQPYIIFASAQAGHTSATVSTYIHLTDDGVEKGQSVFEGPFTNLDYPFGIAYGATYDGSSNTWALGRRAETTSNTVGIENPALILAIPIDGGGRHSQAAISEAGDTVSSASALAIKAAASITEAGDTVASASAVAIEATSSMTETADTLSSTAKMGAINAVADIAEAADTVSSAGALPIRAAAEPTEASDTLSAAGELPIAATAAISEVADILAAFGGEPPISAELAVTEADDTLSGTGTIPITAAASISEAADTLSAAGDLLITASAAITEADDTVVGEADVTDHVAVAAITEASDTLSAAGLLPLVASAAIVEADDYLLTVPSTLGGVNFIINEKESIRLKKLQALAASVVATTRRLNVYTVKELQAITPTMGLEAHCFDDATAGYVPVFADGANWRRVTDGGVIS